MLDEHDTDVSTNATAASAIASNARAQAPITRATEALTDLHGTKIPADDPRLKLERPRSKTIRRGPVIAIASLLAAAVGIATIVALTPAAPAADDGKKGSDPDDNANTDVTLPDMLRESAEAPGHGTAPPPAGRAGQPVTDTSSTQLRDDAASGSTFQRTEAVRQARSEELARARGAGLFAQVDDGVGLDTAVPNLRNPASDLMAEERRGGAAAPGTQDPARQSDANMQDRKADFLARAGVSSNEYLEKTVTTPRSPYEVKAGTVIPTVLLTGMNSDLPGQVVGQVRENVYDTVTGNYLLIPQGSRVIAAYDSMVAWGQERVLVCWNRIIRPDGTSISLDCMPGVDLSGNAGFSDEVDNHWWRIISGAALSSLFAATAQRSQGDVSGYQPSVSQVWASNTAGQINQAGQLITARNLQIQPTITVRPGWSVNVLVSKDIVLPPYTRGGTR
jgi:type IV secretion system protein VirB10